MKKNPIKYIVNTMLFIDVCAIAAIGLLLAYALKTGDPVVILGQSLGMAVYLRNLQLWGPAPSSAGEASRPLLR